MVQVHLIVLRDRGNNMSNNSELCKLLQKAVNDQRSNIMVDNESFGKLHSAIIVLGKENYEPARALLMILVDNLDSDISGESLAALRKYSGDDQFYEFVKEKAFKIYHETDNDDLKFTAINTLSGFRSFKDPKIIKLLFNILKDYDISTSIRSSAFAGLYIVSGKQSRHLSTSSMSSDILFNFGSIDDDSIEDKEKFENFIDWNEINEIAEEYGLD